MNTNYMSDEELDDLFRKSAENIQPPFEPDAWAAMNRKLDAVQPQPPKGYRGLLPLLAALLISTLAILYLANAPTQKTRPARTRTEAQAQTELPPQRLQENGPSAATKQAATIVKKSATSGNAASGKTSPGAVLSEAKKPAQNTGINPGNAAYTLAANLEAVSPQERMEPAPLPLLSVRFPDETNAGSEVLAVQHDTVRAPLSAAMIPAIDPEKETKNDSSRAHVFGRGLKVSLLVAPDFTTVRFHNPDAVSANAGISIALPLTRKLSLVTGAIWAHKVYAAAPQDYAPSLDFWQGKVLPTSIDARCQVLDIPLNLQWELLAHGKSTLAVQAGLSSYLMLREKYTYEYGSSGYGGYYKTWEVANENYHWFGVQNFSLSYSHTLSPTISVGVEPFVKIPLTSIGAGNIKLTSAGIFLSAGYRFDLKK